MDPIYQMLRTAGDVRRGGGGTASGAFQPPMGADWSVSGGSGGQMGPTGPTMMTMSGRNRSTAGGSSSGSSSSSHLLAVTSNPLHASCSGKFFIWCF